MRSYGQYCGLARGLDVIGDRWVLLIVRELLYGPRRYGELLDGLPGIATNLLADRLRSMQESGLVERLDDERYGLTALGSGLRDVLYAIGRWAYPLMGALADGEEFRSQWIVHPLAAMFPGVDPSRPELEMEVRCGETPMTVSVRDGALSVKEGSAAAPELVLTGPPDAVIGFLAGRVTRSEAEELGLRTTGELRRLRGLKPAL